MRVDAQSAFRHECRIRFAAQVECDLKSYFICSVERSGSTLLAAYLEGTNALGNPLAEPFRIRKELEAVRDHSVISLRQYFEYVTEISATSNGVVGIKLMWRHLARIMAELRKLQPGATESDSELLGEHFPELTHFVLTERRDVIAQAVSWAIAHQTDQWRSSHPVASDAPKYSFRLIYLLHQTVLADYFGWRSWFSANNIEPHRVIYEELVRNPRQVVSALTESILGESVQYPLTGSFPLQQSSAINGEWSAKYREDLSRHLSRDLPSSSDAQSRDWLGL